VYLKVSSNFDVRQVSSNLSENICGASFSTLQDDRRTYITNFMDHLISWDTVTLRMMRAESFVNLGEPNIPVA
jgi:Fe-Mn family superoxide dismutase